MLNFSKNNKTLEPKRNFINNDIIIQEYDLSAVMTIISVCIIFLLSIWLIVGVTPL